MRPKVQQITTRAGPFAAAPSLRIIALRELLESDLRRVVVADVPHDPSTVYVLFDRDVRNPLTCRAKPRSQQQMQCHRITRVSRTKQTAAHLGPAAQLQERSQPTGNAIADREHTERSALDLTTLVKCVQDRF